jgi:hypothetical protein
MQLLDYVEQNIAICQWRADQLFGKQINYLPMLKAEANNLSAIINCRNFVAVTKFNKSVQ